MLAIRAPIASYVRLLRGQDDPDRLFFERLLVMEGDTELGLLVKNALDRVSPPIPTRLLDFEARLKAVREFRQLPEAESLAAANKRIRNILRKAEEQIVAKIQEEKAKNDKLQAVIAADPDLVYFAVYWNKAHIIAHRLRD